MVQKACMRRHSSSNMAIAQTIADEAGASFFRPAQARHRLEAAGAELARFGIAESQIAEGRWDAAWAAMMDFQIDRARAMMASGSPLVHELPGRIGFELRLIVASGFRVLDKLQRVRGDVFRRRPVIGKRDWPAILLHAAFG